MKSHNNETILNYFKDFVFCKVLSFSQFQNVEKALGLLIEQASRLPIDDVMEPISVSEENEENMDFLSTDDMQISSDDIGDVDETLQPTQKHQLQPSTTPMRTRSQTNR